MGVRQALRNERAITSGKALKPRTISSRPEKNAIGKEFT
jgi:hypothetical protein